MGHYAEFSLALCDALQQPMPGYDSMVSRLVGLRERQGRLFILGVGGGAANAAHAVNDFRKLCGIEAYAPTDGGAEITARTNDDGWANVFQDWLAVSRLNGNDAILVFSVGGGTTGVSQCIFYAVHYARNVGASIFSVVGKPDGAAARLASTAIIVAPRVKFMTPVTETVQIAILHALVSDPRLQITPTKW